MESALNLIHEEASQHQAQLIRSAGSALVFDVSPTLPSGGNLTYRLRVEAVGTKISVREDTPTLLPTFCPERHINPGGSFCLFWRDAEPLEIKSREKASEWWGKVLMFLTYQHSAAALRVWPGRGNARAHGDAARHQAEAEATAQSIGPLFAQALSEGRLAVKTRNIRGNERLRLYFDNIRIVSVLADKQQTMSLRIRCKCGRTDLPPQTLKSCSTHARDFATLARALRDWELAEADFYRNIRNRNIVCCGTMDDCPLAEQQSITLQAA